jgi:hypothetical protein
MADVPGQPSDMLGDLSGALGADQIALCLHFVTPSAASPMWQANRIHCLLTIFFEDCQSIAKAHHLGYCKRPDCMKSNIFYCLIKMTRTGIA